MTEREAASDLAHDEAAVIAARLHRVEADLVDLAVRVVDEELWAGGGILSPEHWLVLRVGLSPARAHDVTRVARTWAAMPTLAGALRSGAVSLDQAAVVAKFVPSEHERAATELAEQATVPQLRRALSRYQFADRAGDDADPARGGENAAEPGTQLAGEARAAEPPAGPDTTVGEQPASASWPVAAEGGTGGGRGDGPAARPPTQAVVVPPLRDPEGAMSAGSMAWALQPPELAMGHADGRFWMRFSAPSDLGALAEQALLEAKDALFRAATAGTGEGDGSTRPSADALRVTLGDAMVDVAHRSLSTVESTSRAQRYRVYVHLSVDGSWVNGRGAIPPSLAAKFACDGVVQPIWEVDGAPVSVGRDQRIVPDRSRRLIEDRDRGCRYPGCPATRHVEVHHLDHRADGGATDLERMLSLCPRHHDTHHRGEFSLHGDPTRLDGVVFRNARGREIRVGSPPRPSPAPVEHGPPDPRSDDVEPYYGPTGERLLVKWVTLPSNSELARHDAWRRRIAEPAPMTGSG